MSVRLAAIGAALSFLTLLAPARGATIEVDLADLNNFGDFAIAEIPELSGIPLDGSRLELWFVFANDMHIELANPDINFLVSAAQSLRLVHSDTQSDPQPVLFDASFGDPMFGDTTASPLTTDHQSPINTTFYNAAIPSGFAPDGISPFRFHSIHFDLQLPDLGMETLEVAELWLRPGAGGSVTVGVWVPEPSSLVAGLGVAICGLAFCGRRRRRD